MNIYMAWCLKLHIATFGAHVHLPIKFMNVEFFFFQGTIYLLRSLTLVYQKTINMCTSGITRGMSFPFASVCHMKGILLRQSTLQKDIVRDPDFKFQEGRMMDSLKKIAGLKKNFLGAMHLN